jgi:hypothetical protein
MNRIDAPGGAAKASWRDRILHALGSVNGIDDEEEAWGRRIRRIDNEVQSRRPWGEIDRKAKAKAAAGGEFDDLLAKNEEAAAGGADAADAAGDADDYAAQLERERERRRNPPPAGPQADALKK